MRRTSTATRKVFLAILGVTALVAGNPIARGDDPQAPGSDGPAPRDQAREPDQAAREESARVYREGAALYEAGDYVGALERFQRAYELVPSSVLLFNIAQALRLAGRCQEALGVYDQALIEDPDAPNRTEILERIAEMQRCVRAEEKSQPPPPDPSPPPPPPPEGHRSRVPLWVAGAGAGVALLGGGIYLAARREYFAADDRCPCPEGTFDGWERATYASYALLVAGAGIAAAGLVWWVLSPVEQRESRPSVGVAPAPGGVTAIVRF